jgi:hypothetical protein
MDRRGGVPTDGLALVQARPLRLVAGPRRWVEVGIVIAATAAGLLYTGRVSDQAVTPANTRPVEEFRIVPVRVHLLRAESLPAVGTKLTREDITRIFRKANGIWHAAGIHLWIESMVEEKPARALGYEDDIPLPTEVLKALRPADSRPEGMFHVYYVGKIVVNGIYQGRDSIFVQEAARLNPVPGGIDEPLPRVTSHELGHGLQLPHRQARTNLMASGTTGTSLNEQEIEAARHASYEMRWVKPPDAFLTEADTLAAAGKKNEARSRYQAVLELPGDSALKERAKDKLAAL